jgi:hypothetical protein
LLALQKVIPVQAVQAAFQDATPKNDSRMRKKARRVQ